MRTLSNSKTCVASQPPSTTRLIDWTAVLAPAAAMASASVP
jgi:hypothetical protein